MQKVILKTILHLTCRRTARGKEMALTSCVSGATLYITCLLAEQPFTAMPHKAVFSCSMKWNLQCFSAPEAADWELLRRLILCLDGSALHLRLCFFLPSHLLLSRLWRVSDAGMLAFCPHYSCHLAESQSECLQDDTRWAPAASTCGVCLERIRGSIWRFWKGLFPKSLFSWAEMRFILHNQMVSIIGKQSDGYWIGLKTWQIYRDSAAAPASSHILLNWFLWESLPSRHYPCKLQCLQLCFMLLTLGLLVFCVWQLKPGQNIYKNSDSESASRETKPSIRSSSRDRLTDVSTFQLPSELI